MKQIILAASLFVVFTTSAEARKTSAAHPDCNITMPCEGVANSARGERVVKAMGGFGSAQKVYTRKVASRSYESVDRAYKYRVRGIQRDVPVTRVAAQMLPHPAGCPRSLFCGCGAAMEVFGTPRRDLWLAANWLRFPRTSPASGMVAARRGHVFVLKQQLGNGSWLVADYNSGGRQSRLHVRSLSGYTIVNPRA